MRFRVDGQILETARAIGHNESIVIKSPTHLAGRWYCLAGFAVYPQIEDRTTALGMKVFKRKRSGKVAKLLECNWRSDSNCSWEEKPGFECCFAPGEAIVFKYSQGATTGEA